MGGAAATGFSISPPDAARHLGDGVHHLLVRLSQMEEPHMGEGDLFYRSQAAGISSGFDPVAIQDSWVHAWTSTEHMGG